MVTTSTISPSPPLPSSIFNPKPQYSLIGPTSFLPITSPLKRKENSTHAICKKPTKFWTISAIPGNFLLSEADPIGNSEQIVSTNADGVSYIISVLLGIAFIGLSILTVGVIYIAVTDFLGKREREKFEKEEAAAKKKSSRKGKGITRSRAGPRGFGQKIDEEDGDDFDLD